jgi:type I restriction enzyme S subunit
MSWTDCELGDVVTLKRGHDLPNDRRVNGDIPVVSSSGITGWHNEARAEPPGVVTGRYGTIGEVFYLDRPYWPLNTALYAIDFHGNDPKFVAYFLRNQLKNYQSEKAAVPGVDRNVLHKIKVRCPDPQAQERIVSILSAYDDLIENNRRRIGLLEQAARLLYREWFVHLRFPGHETAKIVDDLPEGWERLAASEAMAINPRTTLKVSESKLITMVPMGALSTSGMSCDPSQFERREQPAGVKFMNGDTLFARITPCLENGKTGYVNFLQEGEVACGSTEFVVFRERRISRFMAYLLAREEGFRRNAITSMVGSSGRQRVQPSCFDKFLLPVPPKPVVEDFDRLVEPMFREIEHIDKAIGKLTRARDLLLPRLMDGRIPV